MNFLSHFYHELPTNDPYFAAGVILPDILSNYTYRTGDKAKIHPWKLEKDNDPALLSLSTGLKRHYALDTSFHESDFFHSNTHLIHGIIAAQPFRCFPKRQYAVDHVLLELILDRMLLKRSTGPCDYLYALLEEVDPAKLTTFVALHAKAQFPENVAVHFNRFVRARFLYDYTDDERFTGLLDMINRRLGNPPFTAEDHALFKPTIYAVENAIFPQNFPKFPTDS